jgi:hypothetical protein
MKAKESLVFGRKGKESRNLVAPHKRTLWVQACNSVDLESVFPTHGVVGSNPTKPKNLYERVKTQKEIGLNNQIEFFRYFCFLIRRFRVGKTLKKRRLSILRAKFI